MWPDGQPASPPAQLSSGRRGPLVGCRSILTLGLVFCVGIMIGRMSIDQVRGSGGGDRGRLRLRPAGARGGVAAGRAGAGAQASAEQGQTAPAEPFDGIDAVDAAVQRVLRATRHISDGSVAERPPPALARWRAAWQHRLAQSPHRTWLHHVAEQTVASPLAAAHNRTYYLSVCQATKWDEDRIVEWVARNYLEGVDHFYLAVPRDEPADSLLRRVLAPAVDLGLVTLFKQPHDTQVGKTASACSSIAADETVWLAYIDTDQFVLLADTPMVRDMSPRIPRTSRLARRAGGEGAWEEPPLHTYLKRYEQYPGMCLPMHNVCPVFDVQGALGVAPQAAPSTSSGPLRGAGEGTGAGVRAAPAKTQAQVTTTGLLTGRPGLTAPSRWPNSIANMALRSGLRSHFVVPAQLYSSDVVDVCVQESGRWFGAWQLAHGFEAHAAKQLPGSSRLQMTHYHARNSVVDMLRRDLRGPYTRMLVAEDEGLFFCGAKNTALDVASMQRASAVARMVADYPVPWDEAARRIMLRRFDKELALRVGTGRDADNDGVGAGDNIGGGSDGGPHAGRWRCWQVLLDKVKEYGTFDAALYQRWRDEGANGVSSGSTAPSGARVPAAPEHDCLSRAPQMDPLGHYMFYCCPAGVFDEALWLPTEVVDTADSGIGSAARVDVRPGWLWHEATLGPAVSPVARGGGSITVITADGGSREVVASHPSDTGIAAHKRASIEAAWSRGELVTLVENTLLPYGCMCAAGSRCEPFPSDGAAVTVKAEHLPASASTAQPDEVEVDEIVDTAVVGWCRLADAVGTDWEGRCALHFDSMGMFRTDDPVAVNWRDRWDAYEAGVGIHRDGGDSDGWILVATSEDDEAEFAVLVGGGQEWAVANDGAGGEEFAPWRTCDLGTTPPSYRSSAGGSRWYDGT